MKETIKTIMDWHEQTFPDATLEGQLAKYQEEQREWVESGEKDLSELADMFIVACGIARFDLWEGAHAFWDVYEWMDDSKVSPKKVFKTVEKKMEINKKRKWQKSNGFYHHIEKGDKND